MKLILMTYLTADLSDVAKLGRLTNEEQSQMLKLLEKVCDYHGTEN